MGWLLNVCCNPYGQQGRKRLIQEDEVGFVPGLANGERFPTCDLSV